MKNSPEVKFLLNLLNKTQNNLKVNNIHWDRFMQLVKSHELIALTFYRLKKYHNDISQDIYSYLESGYQFNLSRNLKFWNEFIKIYEAFRSKEILFLPIKGIDLMARFYPELHLRSMADIDILVKEEEFNQAEKILYELGYQKQLCGLKEEYWRKKQCHIEFDTSTSLSVNKKPFIVEVHWGLDFKRGNRIILHNLWERTKEIEIENYKINLLSPEDALFSFALHNRRMGRILSLKQVLDVARIINESLYFDWNYVLNEAKKGKMQATIYFLLMQISLFTKTNTPQKILRKLNIGRWQKKLIKHFLANYTFKISSSMKNNYLKAHFLLYDSLWEPISYIINIPYEQFCKFYNLKPYTEKTNLLYRMRFLHLPIKQILQLASRKLY